MKLSIDEWLKEVSKIKGNNCQGIGCIECPFYHTECDSPGDFKDNSNRLYKKYTKLKKLEFIEEILK